MILYVKFEFLALAYYCIDDGFLWHKLPVCYSFINFVHLLICFIFSFIKKFMTFIDLIRVMKEEELLFSG